MDFADYVKAVSDRELSVFEIEGFNHIAKLLQEAPNGKVYISMPPGIGRVLISNEMANKQCRICGCTGVYIYGHMLYWAKKDLCCECYDRMRKRWWGRLWLWINRKRGALG